jgi:DNA-binding NtrC family response regulator/CHASE2 domain-containing sensor protein
LHNRLFIKISFVILIASLIFLFPNLTGLVDSVIGDKFKTISGETIPDSNIVIIEINSADIEQIGPWPIKRSYYALLIQQLNKYKVNKIGIEVFLSTKFATQSIYDNVLVKEIEKSSNVVLSSLAGSINEKSNQFVTDEFSEPSPRLLDSKIPSGHINYLKDNGFIIPLTIQTLRGNEKAFSSQLLSKQNTSGNKIKVNIISSWQKFKHYSLIEFFQLAEENDSGPISLRDKYILVGVNVPQLSSLLETPFDDEMPGIALHAFALDNLLNGRYTNTSFYLFSKLFFSALIFLLTWLFNYRNIKFYWYSAAVVFLFIAVFILQRYFYFELSYISFLFPLIVLILSDTYFIIVDSKKQLKGFYSEAVILKNLLSEKEKELSVLKNDINLSNSENSIALQQKISELENNIKKLKENEEDRKEADINVNKDDNIFYGLVYKSLVMHNVVELIKKSAPTDATILITGESGTGKELVARAIHNLSKRNNEKFVAINCAALTESLLESELFGHVKGAFTGAVVDKAGKFELANNGTIFLDEIGETSENFQVKLLRVLQSGEYDKVGATNTSKANVRVIAATNKDVKQLVKEKKFREDLFYRLNVFDIHIPSLRERKEDIIPITNYLLQTDDKKYQISIAAIKALNMYNWNGNVRELESVIKRAKVFCDASSRIMIELNDLPDELVKSIKLNFENIVIESLRNKRFSHSSINETAKELGNVNRTIISENFRGLSLKYYVECNYDFNTAAINIAGTDDVEIIEKVKSKLDTWITNIKKDLEGYKPDDFVNVKAKFSSKYKNLPQKFHIYLDEVIKHLIK